MTFSRTALLRMTFGAVTLSRTTLIIMAIVTMTFINGAVPFIRKKLIRMTFGAVTLR
jgi:hypothetical protein